MAITGYDGDPNAGGAPAILQGAPVGSWYLRETPLLFYRRSTAVSTSWEVSTLGTLEASRLLSVEDLTIPVDYNDVTAVDPPADVFFSTQTEIDDFLTSNSTTAFKHLVAVWEALPALIKHRIRFDLATGVHRPRNPEPLSTIYAWPLLGKLSLGGTIDFVGSTSGWDVIGGLSGLSITATQISSNDPWLDVSGTPFAGLDLGGYFVELSTGQFMPIHDNTDSRLHFTGNLSPDPNGGTCSVVRPSTILRNSYDDSTRAFFNRAILVNSTGENSFLSLSEPITGLTGTRGSYNFYNLRVDSFGALQTFAFEAASTGGVYQCHEDREEQVDTFGASFSFGRFVQKNSGADTTVFRSSCRADPATPTGREFIYVASNATMTLRESIMYGQVTRTGVFCTGGTLFFRSIVDLNGAAQIAIELLDNATIIYQHFNNVGADNAVRNAVNGLMFRGPSQLGLATSQSLLISDMSGAAVALESNVVILASDPQWIDGGGNLDVGIDLTGGRTALTITPATTVTGVVGDLRFNGQLFTYAELGTDSPVTDNRSNQIIRE